MSQVNRGSSTTTTTTTAARRRRPQWRRAQWRRVLRRRGKTGKLQTANRLGPYPLDGRGRVSSTTTTTTIGLSRGLVAEFIINRRFLPRIESVYIVWYVTSPRPFIFSRPNNSSFSVAKRQGPALVRLTPGNAEIPSSILGARGSLFAPPGCEMTSRPPSLSLSQRKKSEIPQSAAVRS